MNNKIGIIGFGNMGSAIGERIKFEYQVYAFDIDKNKTNKLTGIKVANSITDLLTKVDTVILSLKPQDFDAALDEIKNFAEGKLIITIAVGITIDYIEKRLGKVRVIRVMPNLPARIGEGMICLCVGKSVSEEEARFAEELFKNLGTTLILNEKMMNAATAISGSGPGYLYDWGENKAIEEIKKYARDIFIPSLTVSAESLGFTPQQAKILVNTTAQGSLSFLEKANLSAAQLKKQVASKGGTTEAGLEVLHKGGSLEEAVKKAFQRAKELSKRG